MCLNLCHGTKEGNPNIGFAWAQRSVRLHHCLQTAAVVVTLRKLICKVVKEQSPSNISRPNLSQREAVDWTLIKVVGGQRGGQRVVKRDPAV